MGIKTYKEIVKKATECYNNTKKNHKNGIVNQWAYYICKAILTPGKDIPQKGVQPAPNPIALKKIDAVISKTEYLSIIKKFVEFVEKDKNHNLPNYIVIKGIKVSPTLFTAFVSYILYKYNKDKKLPSTQGIKSAIYSIPEKIHEYLTEEGCSGMGQCTPYYCACNSLQQSFYRLTGILVSESTIAGWAGTTTDGTDHEGINTAVAQFNRKYNKNVQISWYNFSDLSWTKISDFIKKGAVFFHLLYRNQWGHYEPIKSVGDYLSILNSLGDRCGGNTYCGYIETRSKAEQKSYISGISQKSVAVLYNG